MNYIGRKCASIHRATSPVLGILVVGTIGIPVQNRTDKMFQCHRGLRFPRARIHCAYSLGVFAFVSNFPIPNRPTLVSEQSANPKLDSSAQSEGQISQTRGPRKSSAWKYLVSLACVGAGVLVAVQLINPADQSVEEFAELEVSAGLDTISLDSDAADEDVAVSYTHLTLPTIYSV